MDWGCVALAAGPSFVLGDHSPTSAGRTGDSRKFGVNGCAVVLRQVVAVCGIPGMQADMYRDGDDLARRRLVRTVEALGAVAIDRSASAAARIAAVDAVLELGRGGAAGVRHLPVFGVEFHWSTPDIARGASVRRTASARPFDELQGPANRKDRQ